MPLLDVFVDNWYDLRSAIATATAPTVITILQSFDTTSVPTGSLSPPNPAAITLNQNANITITSPPGQTHTIIQRHSAAGNAARHFILGVGDTDTGNTILTLENVTLSGDQTLTHFHGGVHVNSPNSHFIMNDGASIINCYALDGGAVSLRALNAQFTMNGGVIAHNEAVQRGGALFQQDRTTFSMSGGVIQQNAAQDGGGIHAGTSQDAAPSVVNISVDAHIYNNRSDRFGGGMYLRDHITLNMTGSRISDNISGTDGGGIYVRNTPVAHRTTSININGGYINDNTASNDGGGIFTSNSIYNNPLDYNLPSAYHNLNIGTGVRFYRNSARQWFFPPTIINAPASTPANQLPHIQWNPVSGSSVPIAGGGYHYLLNNYDINFAGSSLFWYLGNHPYFTFTKTDDVNNPRQGTELTGAWFRLYWRPAANEDWVAVDTSVSNNAQGIVRLPLIAAPSQYRLVEIVAPQGFQAPWGHWIIDTARVDGQVSVTAISEHDRNPRFVQYPALTGSWYVGNMRDFELPLTGGLGGDGGILLTSAVAGTVVICMAFATFGAMKVKKTNRMRIGAINK